MYDSGRQTDKQAGVQFVIFGLTNVTPLGGEVSGKVNASRGELRTWFETFRC